MAAIGRLHTNALDRMATGIGQQLDLSFFMCVSYTVLIARNVINSSRQPHFILQPII